MTVDEVAKTLKVSAATVRRMLVRGQLPGRKVGVRQWRVSAAALKSYIAGDDKPNPATE